MVLVKSLFFIFKAMMPLDGHLLCQVTDPDQIDASRPQSQLACARLQGRLRHHLSQDGIDSHRDAFRRYNGDRAIAAIDLDAVARARIIPRLALHLTVGFMPLYLGKGLILQPQRQYKCQYDQQSFHRPKINLQSYIYFSEETNL